MSAAAPRLLTSGVPAHAGTGPLLRGPRSASPPAGPRSRACGSRGEWSTRRSRFQRVRNCAFPGKVRMKPDHPSAPSRSPQSRARASPRKTPSRRGSGSFAGSAHALQRSGQRVPPPARALRRSTVRPARRSPVGPDRLERARRLHRAQPGAAPAARRTVRRRPDRVARLARPSRVARWLPLRRGRGAHRASRPRVLPAGERAHRHLAPPDCAAARGRAQRRAPCRARGRLRAPPRQPRQPAASATRRRRARRRRRPASVGAPSRSVI